ncbi:ABC transporter substrate-binding protein [Geomonas sp. Red276]
MNRSDNIARSQLRIGIFVVVALALLCLGILLLGEKTKMFTSKGRVTLIMTDVAGLKEGAPVWLAGVEIGVVRSIRFERPEANNNVEILLEVEKESQKKIGKDSVITIKTRGLMGEKYVDITPSAHLVTVPETRVYGTNVPKLDDVMQKAAAAFDNLNATMEKIVSGKGTMGQMITDPRLYQNLTQLTAEMNTFVATANQGKGTIGKLNRNPEIYEKLVSTLERADRTLADIQNGQGTMHLLLHDRALYDKLLSLADKSRQAADDMHAMNVKLLSPQGTIGKLVQDRELYDKGVAAIERADRSMASLQEVLERVKSGQGTAGRLVNERALYDKLNGAVDDLDSLLKDVREHPRRYFKFSLF